MKSLRRRLEEVSKASGIRLDILQQDYLLSWVLVGISRVKELSAMLVLKGGTALKKCFFGDYRFSEDLDFTALEKDLAGQQKMNRLFQNVHKITQEIVQEHAAIDLFFENYKEKTPHPKNQQAYVVRAKFPWQREALTTVMIEISYDEDVCLPILERSIFHSYGEIIEDKVNCYSLEEIIIEKLRAIIQNTKKMHERGWSRSRVRDYYDILNIFKSYEDKVDLTLIGKFLERKFAKKSVMFPSTADFFDPIIMQQIKTSWNNWLSPLTVKVPMYEEALKELKQIVSNIIDSIQIQYTNNKN